MAKISKRGRKAPPRARRRPAAPSPGGSERFELAMRALNEGLYDWDIAHDRIYYSDGVHRAVGMSPGEIRTPRDWRNRIHPEDLPKPDAALTAHFKGEATRRLRAEGATAYLAKPYSPFDLLNLIRKLLPET